MIFEGEREGGRATDHGKDLSKKVDSAGVWLHTREHQPHHRASRTLRQGAGVGTGAEGTAVGPHHSVPVYRMPEWQGGWNLPAEVNAICHSSREEGGCEPLRAMPAAAGRVCCGGGRQRGSGQAPMCWFRALRPCKSPFA